MMLRASPTRRNGAAMMVPAACAVDPTTLSSSSGRRIGGRGRTLRRRLARSARVGCLSGGVRAGLKDKACAQHRAKTYHRNNRFSHDRFSAAYSDQRLRARCSLDDSKKPAKGMGITAIALTRRIPESFGKYFPVVDPRNRLKEFRDQLCACLACATSRSKPGAIALMNALARNFPSACHGSTFGALTGPDISTLVATCWVF